MTGLPADALAASGQVRPWWLAIGGALSGSLVVLAALWPTPWDLAQSWLRNGSYEYAWIVLPMLAYLLGWHNRNDTLAAPPRPDHSGLMLALAAATLWVLATLLNMEVGRQLGLVLALQGVAMAALGWRSYWRLFPTLALLFLLVPSGDLLLPVLRQLTVWMIQWFAMLTGLPHTVDGFVIRIGKGDYVVLNECAGLPYFLMATFLGYSFGLMLYRSVARIAAMALFGAFIGLLSNGLRVNAIVMVDWLQGSQMPLTGHGDYQRLAVIAALLLLFVVLGRLTGDGRRASGGPPPAAIRSARWSVMSPLLAGLGVAIVAGPLAWTTPSTAAAPATANPIVLPATLAGWTRVDAGSVWVNDETRQTMSLRLTYRQAGQELQLQVVEALAPQAKLQESDLTPAPARDWTPNSIRTETQCSAAACIDVRHTLWEHGVTARRRHLFVTYAVGRHITASRFAQRVVSGWNRVTGRREPARMVGLTLPADPPTALPPQAVPAFLAALIEALDASPR